MSGFDFLSLTCLPIHQSGSNKGTHICVEDKGKPTPPCVSSLKVPVKGHSMIPTSLAFSGVPLGEGEAGDEGSLRSRSQSRSRWISLLLGSFRVLLSSLMLAWCFNKTSSGLSRN